MNHLQEDSMSHFIRTQIMNVLQPFLDHVEDNDQRISKLEDLVDTADDRITSTLDQLDNTNSAVKSTIENLRQTDRRVEAAHEGLHKASDRMDQLQRGLEQTTEYAERIHSQARGLSAEVPELRRYAEDIATRLQALRGELQRLSDGSMAQHKARLDALTDDVKGLQVDQERSKTATETLRGEVQEETRLLHDARQELSKQNNSIGAVQQTIKDMLTREKELGGQVEGLKANNNKMQPAVDGLKKDVVFLKQSAESHDASIHGLQRGQQALTESFEGLHSVQAKMTVELDATRRALKQTNQDVAEVKDNMGHTTAFANSLNTRLDQTAVEHGNTLLQLRGLEGKHQALGQAVDKAIERQDQMLQDNRKAANDFGHMQRDHEKTNENVATGAKQLEVLSRGLQNTKGELGHLADRVAQIESSTQALHGGFAGLQKGFVASGAEMGTSVASKKSERLPRLASKLSANGSPRNGSPRPGSPSFPGTPRSMQFFQAADKVVDGASARDDNSTTAGTLRLGMNGVLPSPPDSSPRSTQ